MWGTVVARPMTTSHASMTTSRPASIGGGVPAPGTYGLVTGFTAGPYAP